MTAQPALPPLSIGTLFFMFGERVLPAEEKSRGSMVLYSGARVAAYDMAAVMFAASIWNLRQAGALLLQEVTQKALGLIEMRHVQLTMQPNVSLRSGYEDVVMRGVGPGATAHDVVYRWFGEDVYSPPGHALTVANDEMERWGLARRADAGRGKIGGFLKGDTKLEPNHEQIAAWSPTFDHAHGGWRQFCQAEPTLAGTLVETCKLALTNRRKQARDRDDW